MFATPRQRCDTDGESETLNDMNVEKNLTAHEQRQHAEDGSGTITIHTNLGDEDEDVHKCGRCQNEFSTLEAFIQHKLRHSCRRESSSQSEEQMVEASNGSTQAVQEAASSEPESTNIKNTNASTAALGRGCRKKSTSLKVSKQSETPEVSVSDNAESDKPVYKINVDGRYLCQLCDKTFKTSNILKTHMKTHSDQKNFACDLCDTSFRTKGSLIRHNRRHSDERPYHCMLCGQSFRESGALTRHLKSLTPCIEKIRFSQCKEILVSKDGMKKDCFAETGQQEVVEDQPAEEQVVEAQTAVISLVEAGSQEVIHQVHFTMEVDGTTQEQQVIVDQSQAEALAAAAGDNLICQAILNSGIALRTEEGVHASQATDELEKMVIQCPGADGTEVQVKEELVEVVAREAGQTASKLYTCPHCNRSFKGLNYFRFHVKGHSGYKPFRCTLCQRDFLSGYLLKKHMDVHVSERRYKCGECGKLYKTRGHVQEHMRAHSNERPHTCARCKKAYKTKNALQVHQRTHGEEKPYVCQFCFRGFREKGSLVRHTRHHTGEKPFKCPKCGRGFAEHGTLNRHVRAKGGCHKDESGKQQQQREEELVVTEEQVSGENLATTAIITEDPHALLVEFSSVVADTQEYIIKTQTDEEVHEEQVTLIQDSQNEMGKQIVKVVQQIVSQSHSAGSTGSHQIILRNVSGGEEGASIVDCGDTITIATPESLTEQVAMTLASAISDGTLLADAVKTAQGTVAMVTMEEAVEEGIQLVEQQQEEEEEYDVITTPQEVEIHTVIV
ncbi:transcription factor E4F1 isoform X2 [Phyllopteryx taeniolatus]|uniref:transcription factor E4F1 isoform X2 n=1 Tax=Phyllopteryx taeniolatus TaxID=161469 RepID=UPI002AD3B5A9|nr:transcription factor E4F1 isoform X2 [Phyllopteryx taeniolatus]